MKAFDFLTSLHHNQVDIFMENDAASQVELVCIGFHFELLGWILQVPDSARQEKIFRVAEDPIHTYALATNLYTVM